MDNIIVPFKNVRGLGNIVAPKSSTDFEPYLCDISTGSETIDGITTSVQVLEYNPEGVIITVTKKYVKSSGTITITATVRDASGNPVNNATVKFYKED